MHVFDIAWFSSAIAFAALIYVIEPFEPPGGPKGPLIPILIDGRVVRVPPAFIDAWSETSKFTAEFEVALQEAVPGLRSSSGTLWTTRIIRNKKPELVGALRGMDEYVLFFPKMYEAVTFYFSVSAATIQLCSTKPPTLTIAVRISKRLSTCWPTVRSRE